MNTWSKTASHFKRMRLPVAALAAVLQRTPAVRVAAAAADYFMESPAGALLKAAVASAAALGAVDTVAGASASTATLITDIQLPATVAVGHAFRMDITVTGTAVTFAKSWDVSNTLPPGITVQGATLSGNLWVINDDTAASGILTISGTPTKAGTYNFTVDAWQNTNRSGSVTPGSTSIAVTGGATGTAPTITSQPAGETVNAGSSVTLSVVASGSPAPSYQWMKNSAPVAGATGSSLDFSAAQASDGGIYSVVVTNSAGSVTSQSVTLTVNNVAAAPVFTVQPGAQTISNGSTVVFKAAATGAPAPTLQWELNGVAIPGATSPVLMISGATFASAGAYTCAATNASGTVASEAAALTVISTPDIGRLINISCRAAVGTGGNVLIAGFVIGGTTTPGSEQVLVRGSGPALGLPPFNLPGVLPDPQLALTDVTTTPYAVVATDTGWKGAAAIQGAAASVGAFPWGTASVDSALFTPLPEGNYTAEIAGASNDTGVALAEVYDATPAGTYTPASPRITNISARVPVGAGANILIAGFVVGGSTSRTVLIRASGPSLVQFGVPGTLPDPQLQLFSGSTVIASNNGWAGDPQILAAANSVGAFNWPFASSNDSAILVTLPPGDYTAQVSGVSGDTGVALVEVYEIP